MNVKLERSGFGASIRWTVMEGLKIATHNDSTLPAEPTSIAGMAAEQARIRGDQPAIVATDGPPLSYSEVWRLIQRSTATLRELGIGQGDIVALAMPNGPEMATGFLALASAAICAPLNPLLTEKNHLDYLSDLNAKAVLICDGMPEVELAARKLETPILKIFSEPHIGSGCFNIQLSTRGSGERVLPLHGPQGPDLAEPEREDIALILPTSGTTSKPKLVPLSHRNLCASARHIRETLLLDSSDRCLNMMPLFHIHGLVAALLSTYSSGGSLICTPGFSSGQFINWVTELNPTWYSAVPTIHQSVLGGAGQIKRSLTTPLRFVRSSSASLPPKVMADLEELFDCPIIEAYGMTEAAHQMASNPISPGRQKPGMVGPPAGPEIMIVDESGNPAPAGSVGEIVIRGENVIRGYLNNEAANREAFRDGWFRTGDQGRFDEDGYLCLTGRTKELINRGGEKIAPREIEEVLLEHPAVNQAVSFAMPHRTLGEEVAAAVVIRPDSVISSDQLRQFASNRLPPFKIPRIICFVPEIPKGHTGKLQRIGLAERLGIGETGADVNSNEYIAPKGALEEQIAKIWQETLRRDRIGTHDDFFLLGGDSLLAVEVVTRVSADIVDIQHVSIYENSRLKDFAQVVQTELDDPKEVNNLSSSVVPIRVAGTSPPVFCLPGHENKFGIFCRVARHLGSDQPVYGLSYPALSDENDHYSINRMADDLIIRMREIQPHGHYRIIGYCFGGYVAFEIARRLRELGQEVELLCLIDTYLPRALRLSASHPAEGLMHMFDFHLKALESRRALDKLGYIGDRIRALFREILIRGEKTLFGRFMHHRRPVPVFLRRYDIASRFAVQELKPAPYDGRVQLIRMEDQRSDAGLMGWQEWLQGEVDLFRVPFHEEGMYSEECVAIFGAQLAKILEKQEA